jgi:hypothetical protein
MHWLSFPRASLTALIALASVGPFALASEIGPHDFRISDMGPDGHVNFAARHPALPHNPRADDGLVIWAGDDDTGMLVEDEVGIFGQLIFIPEPSRWLLLAAGLGCLVVLYRVRVR